MRNPEKIHITEVIRPIGAHDDGAARGGPVGSIVRENVRYIGGTRINKFPEGPLIVARHFSGG